jgi:hypothetical protein
MKRAKASEMSPNIVKVVCTPSAEESVPAIRFPKGITPANESMNTLITRPRISSGVLTCIMELMLETLTIVLHPTTARNIRDRVKLFDWEK